LGELKEKKGANKPAKMSSLEKSRAKKAAQDELELNRKVAEFNQKKEDVPHQLSATIRARILNATSTYRSTLSLEETT